MLPSTDSDKKQVPLLNRIYTKFCEFNKIAKKTKYLHRLRLITI